MVVLTLAHASQPPGGFVTTKFSVVGQCPGTNQWLAAVLFPASLLREVQARMTRF